MILWAVILLALWRNLISIISKRRASFIASVRQPMTFHAWARNPIYGFSFESPPADTGTSVQVRMSRNATSLVEGSSVAVQAAANLLVFSQAHQAIVLSYTQDGLVEGLSAVVEL